MSTIRTILLDRQVMHPSKARKRSGISVLVRLTALPVLLCGDGHAQTSPLENTVLTGLALHADREFDRATTLQDAVRVVIRSRELASIGAEINARITYLPQREGDLVRKGEPLVEFDCDKIIAEHDAAVAALRMRQAVLRSQVQMKSYNATGTLAVDQARYDVEKSEAEVRGVIARRKACSIIAPFDSRVTDKLVQMHEIAQPNQPLLKIINEGKIELVMMVPSALLGEVPNGTRFSVHIDEIGETLQARVIQSTGAIDPISQSGRLIAELVDDCPAVRPGMSGVARFMRKDGAR